jgi:carbonic anhydrase/acetyltransferase-like protein (isoleucine patch superfamily)
MHAPLGLRVVRSLFQHGERLVRHHITVQAWRSRGVAISERALIVTGSCYDLQIGDGSSIGAYTLIDLGNDPARAMAERPICSALRVGRRTAINEFNNIRAGGGVISIGDNCLIAQFVSIIASNHSIDVTSPIRDAPWESNRNYVEIGNDVWIGASSVILPGVKIGTGSVVGAGSVVTHDVEPYSVVAGVPARFVRYRNRVSVGS